MVQIWLRPLLGTQGLKNIGRYFLSRGEETESGGNPFRESFAKKAARYQQPQR